MSNAVNIMIKATHCFGIFELGTVVTSNRILASLFHFPHLHIHHQPHCNSANK